MIMLRSMLKFIFSEKVGLMLMLSLRLRHMFKFMQIVKEMVRLRHTPWLIVGLKKFRGQFKVNGQQWAFGLISKLSNLES